MQYLYVNEWGYGETRVLTETENFNISEILQCEPGYIQLPKWYKDYTGRVQKNAREMIRRGRHRDVHAYILSENKKVKLRRRGPRDGFQVARIPPKYTGGKHLSIAFKPHKTYQSLAPSSYIISVCLNETIRGRRENKTGEKLDLRFYSYGGPCVLFDDWGEQRWKGRGTVDLYQTGVPGNVTFPSLMDYQSLLQVSMACFHRQEHIRQFKERSKAEGRKQLFIWLSQQKDVDDDYMEMLKRFLLPVSDKMELYGVVKARIMEWQEGDKRNPAAPISEQWWFSSSKDEKEGEGKVKVINPLTGRQIKVNGPVYNKLKVDGVI